MYGGYREPKNTEECVNTPVPNSASKAQNSRTPLYRGLSSLSQFHTQPVRPVRSKHLLEELREVYDDIDNSASKRPTEPPGDDALVWDRESLPVGLEWMNPTPSKVKNLSSNTIPETVGIHHTDDSHGKAGLLAATESRNSPSDVHSDVPSVPFIQVKQNDNILGESIPLTRAGPVNELNKENVFTPFKANKLHTDSHVALTTGLFSSSKKCFPPEIRPECKIDSVNYLSTHNAVEKEVLFTPLKRGNVNSTPIDLLHTPAPKKAPSIPVIDDHVPFMQSSSLPDELHLQSNLKKSPSLLTIEPHASLLTPAKPLSQTPALIIPNPPNEKLAVLASKNPSGLAAQENGSSSVANIMTSWKTPAKPNVPASSHPDFKSGPGISHSHFEDKKAATEDSNFKSQENNEALVSLSSKASLPKKTDEAAPREEKRTSLLNSAQKAPLNSCPLKSRSLNQQVVPADPVLVSKGPTEMPPPSHEARKPPVKESREHQSNFANSSTGFNAVGRRCTNDQIFVNGKPYTVLSLLGRGGSSVVYLVLEPVSSKLLAVKCVNLSELDQSTYEGYLNEISLLSQLQDSDCVIRMFDHQHCKDEKILYVVMEKGETDLSKLIREVSRTKKVSPAMTVYYWIEMLNAVSFIHKRGTIHSDLKPANFLLVSGRLKLIDFGIASSIQGDMTSVVKDSMTGTYNYISPEALCSTGCGPDGKSMRFKISYKSDVWSLGCILYNLVYGHTPFQSITNQFMKMTAIANPNHKIPFPPAHGFPKSLLQAMQACLIRNPKLRPSVDELLQYQYLGSLGPNPVEPPTTGLLEEQIRAVIYSSDSSDNKLSSILSLLPCQK